MAFDPLNFMLKQSDINSFKTNGFLLIKKFYSEHFIKYIQNKIDSQIDIPADKYQSGFNRLAFDLFENDTEVESLLKNNKFRTLMHELTGETMLFTQSIGFELKKNVSKGFPWHIGTQSFGYHKAEDFGCTIWAPLAQINTEKQRGGMAYVPKNILSGKSLYREIDPAVFRYLDEQIKNDSKPTLEEFILLRDGPLNDPAIKKLLDYFAVEDDFEVGDALIFDKNVIHRSIMLGDGDIDVRTAFVMRFVSSTSTYDSLRAHNLEIPRAYFNYAGPTKFHLNLCEKDGDLIIDSHLFNNKGYRLLTIQPERS